MIPLSIGRQVSTKTWQERKPLKGGFLGWLLLWAPEVQSHWGFLGDSIDQISGLFSLKEKETGIFLSTQFCHWLKASDHTPTRF